MSRYLRYSVLAPATNLQALADALNRPRSPESGDPGLGPRTCRSDASTYPGYSLDGVPAPTDRGFTLSVPPRDVDRFEAVCDAIDGVQYARWHPEGLDGEYKHPREHAAAEGLKRISEGDNV